MTRNYHSLAGLLLIGCFLACSAAIPNREAQPTMYCVLGKAHNIYALTFSPDGKRLLAGEEHEANDKVVEWDLKTKAVCRRFDTDSDGQIVSLSFSQSGQFLAIGHYTGFVSVRDPKGRSLLGFKTVENRWQLQLVSISEEKKGNPFVYTISGCNIAQRRSIPKGQTNIYFIPIDGLYQIDSAAATRKGTTFVCCSPKFIRVYRERDGFSGPQELKSFKVFQEPCITSVAISDDASMVMAYEYDGDVALFDIKNDKLVKKWNAHDDGTLYTILPFHGLNWFATANESGEIKIWDEKGDRRALLKHKDFLDQAISALALTPDNSFLASSGEDRPIVIWDMRAFLKSVQKK